MLTPFGKEARKWRIDNDVAMKTMASDLGVSVSYLSAVEHGKKPITADTPIVKKLPLKLRQAVYVQMLKHHDGESARLRDLLGLVEKP